MYASIYLRFASAINILLCIMFVFSSWLLKTKAKTRNLDKSTRVIWLFFVLKFLTNFVIAIVYLVQADYFDSDNAESTWINKGFYELNFLMSIIIDMSVNLCYYYFVYELRYIKIALECFSSNQFFMAKDRLSKERLIVFGMRIFVGILVICISCAFYDKMPSD